MKLNWTGVSAVIASLAVVLGWAWSIEHRLGRATDVSGRLRSIEEALYPVLVDYRVNQILHDREHDHTCGSLEQPDAPLVYTPPSGDGAFENIMAPTVDRDPPRLMENVGETGGSGLSAISDLEPAPLPESELIEYPGEMVQQAAEIWAREQLSF